MTVESEKETAEGGSLFYFCKPGLEDRDGDQMPQRRSAPLSDDNKRPPMMTDVGKEAAEGERVSPGHYLRRVFGGLGRPAKSI